MMPTQQLTDFENRCTHCVRCWSLTSKDRETGPLCPHCGYRPIEPTNATASKALDDIDHQHRLVEEWTRTVLGNLRDPTVTGVSKLLTDSKGKTALNLFLTDRALPQHQKLLFVKAPQEVLSGLQKVTLNKERSSWPHSCEAGCRALSENFVTGSMHLAELNKGKDAARVRIVVEH